MTQRLVRSTTGLRWHAEHVCRRLHRRNRWTPLLQASRRATTPSKVGQTNATKYISEDVALRNDAGGYCGKFQWRSRWRLGAISHPLHHVVVSRILRPISKYPTS